MAMVELIIKMPEEKYDAIKSKYNTFPAEMKEWGLEAINNGTLLPKGHGGLKDFQKIYADMTEKVELARQRVIDTPTNSPCYMRYVAQLNERTAFQKMLFEALEESNWIPVSKRLPEDYKIVIASVDHKYVYPEARYSKEYGWEWAYESGADYWVEIRGNVDAWMSLPKPYKPEENEVDK